MLKSAYVDGCFETRWNASVVSTEDSDVSVSCAPATATGGITMEFSCTTTGELNWTVFRGVSTTIF